MRDLVIVAAGDRSLHPKYTPGDAFDLLVLYWGNDGKIFEEYARAAVYADQRKGQKWELVRSLVTAQLSIPLRDYRYVFLPDDDLEFESALQIEKLFEMAASVDADIFQPAILNENFSLCWEGTRKSAAKLCHAVNIVELMMPGYSGPIFSEFVLPSIVALEFQRAGWGLEPFIAKFAEASLGRPLRTFVFDACPVIHTRPVGGGALSHQIGYDEAFLMPMIYSNRMQTLASFDDAGAARDFRFPYVRDLTDQASVQASLAQIRARREVVDAFIQSQLAAQSHGR
jgi:hypothetical protein